MQNNRYEIIEWIPFDMLASIEILARKQRGWMDTLIIGTIKKRTGAERRNKMSVSKFHWFCEYKYIFARGNCLYQIQKFFFFCFTLTNNFRL